MLINGRNLASGAKLTATVCVIGAGPAGLTLARALSRARTDIIVLESGDSSSDPEAQNLNEGRTFGGDYAGLRQTRHRQLGGTVNTWNTPVCGQIGAKYVRLDPWDFNTSPGTGVPGWPIAHADLTPDYDRADAFCGISSSKPDDIIAMAPPPFVGSGGALKSGLYQFGLASQFLQVHGGALHTQPNARLYTNVTALGLTAGAPRRITEAYAMTASGAPIRISAQLFVLAAGAIENARLLLLSRMTTQGLLDDRHGWIGRCFMEHPRDRALSVIARSPELLVKGSFYDASQGTNGTTSGGRIGFSDGKLHARGLPNMSITFLPRERKPGTLAAWSRRLGISASKSRYGWSRMSEPWRHFEGFNILINLEQRPRRDNCVILCADRDRLNQPRALLKWSWSAHEQSGLARLRALIAAEFETSRLGTLHIDEAQVPDPNAHHHAGTTRMSERAEFGVVDADARIHGIDNLYVAGASILPTAGFANPTLTIVALAFRLAAHLATRF